MATLLAPYTAGMRLGMGCVLIDHQIQRPQAKNLQSFNSFSQRPCLNDSVIRRDSASAYASNVPILKAKQEAGVISPAANPHIRQAVISEDSGDRETLSRTTKYVSHVSEIIDAMVSPTAPH